MQGLRGWLCGPSHRHTQEMWRGKKCCCRCKWKPLCRLSAGAAATCKNRSLKQRIYHSNATLFSRTHFFFYFFKLLSAHSFHFGNLKSLGPVSPTSWHLMDFQMKGAAVRQEKENSNSRGAESVYPVMMLRMLCAPPHYLVRPGLQAVKMHHCSFH